MSMTVFPQVFSYCCQRVHEDLKFLNCVNFEILCLQEQDTLCKINALSILDSCRSEDSVHCPGRFLTVVLWEVPYLWIVSGLKASVFGIALLAVPQQFLTHLGLFLISS